MPPRIITRNFANLFRRAQIDIVPGPKIAQDIALVSIVEDLSHLVGPILNASGGVSAVVTAVVGERAVVELEPVSANPLRVWEVQNISSTTTFGIKVVDVGTVFATGPTPMPGGLEWGPARTHGQVQGNQVAAGGDGLPIVPNSIITFSDNPIVIQPGEFFILSMFLSNLQLAAVITWEEVSD